MTMHAALWRAGRARGVQPECRFVRVGGGGHERGIGSFQQLLQPEVTVLGTAERARRHHQLRRDCGLHLGEQRIADNHRLGTAIVGEVFVVGLGEQGVDRDRNQTGADRTEKHHRKVYRVEHDQEHALLWLEAETKQGIACTLHLFRELGVGERAELVIERRRSAASGLELTVHEITGRVERHRKFQGWRRGAAVDTRKGSHAPRMPPICGRVAAMEYDEMDGIAMAEAVRSKQVSADELLTCAIRRVEQTRELNAVVTDMFDVGRAAIQRGLGEGPFHGVPFLLKDLAVSFAGSPLRSGSRIYRDYVPDYDSELVSRWKQAGVTIFGRTNTPEFGILPTTEPELYGPAHNPWKRGYSTGGSSGGAAAAVAARIVPLAHAGDGGGSIRIPASCCGVFGFKPSRAMNPDGPHMSENMHGFAIQHVVTRSVRDSAVMLDQTRGPEVVSPYFGPPVEVPFANEVQRDPGRLRVAFWTAPLVDAKPADREVVAEIEKTAKRMEELGHDVVEAKPTYDQSMFSAAFFRLYCCAAAGEVLNTQRMLKREITRSDVELETWMGALFGRAMTGGEFSLALRDLQTVMRDWARFLSEYDVLLTPVTARVSPRHGALSPARGERLVMETIARTNAARVVKIPGVIDRIVSKAYDFSPYTMFGNAGGLPSMSVPLGMSREGLPIGSLFTARIGRDGTLFSLAAQLERAYPWADRRPAR